MTMNQAWTLTIDKQWIAWLTSDMPGEKVNTFSERTLNELDALLDQLAVNEAIKAVVIRSGKPDCFIAGADIEELARIRTPQEAKEKAEAGHAVFGKIAELPVPTVAAINGSCLGGGLEMALACDYRIVTDHPKTTLGLPEVNLGILPGWGGTQRLPHLLGLGRALPMILAGRPMPGRKAHRIALADAIAAPEFFEDETRRLVDRIVTRTGRRDIAQQRKRRQPRWLRFLCATPIGRRLVYRQARRGIIQKTNGLYPAPLKALEVVAKTYRRRTLQDGLSIEAQAFSELACTSISRNLVWIFQASQRLKKVGASAKQKEPSIRAAGVVGAGIMGGGIAWALSHAGLRVRMKDINWDAIGTGLASAARMFKARVKRRKMTENELNLAMHRIAGTIDYTGFDGLDIVIEAVAENLDIKKHVLREIEAHVRPDTIICTNTSSLPLNELASALRRPKRFVGLHFFNPVNRMPLVEVIGGRATSRETIVAATELVRRLGKTPVVVGDCPGFLVNRILLPYLVESAWMFEEGVDIQRIDRLLEQFGMPMGPLTLVDEVGLDVGYKVAKVLEDAYGQRMRVPCALGAVVESGELTGKKSGAGFYLYNNGHKKPNPKVKDVTAEARKRDHISAQDLTDDQIVDRAILIMVNEAARCLEEGVVADPEVLDFAMVMGTGFAPFRGGLLHYADQRGVGEIKLRLEELAISFGDRFAPAPLLEKIARDGGCFYADGATPNGDAR